MQTAPFPLSETCSVLLRALEFVAPSQPPLFFFLPLAGQGAFVTGPADDDDLFI